MTSVTKTQHETARKTATLDYGAGRLIDVLLSLQHKQFTGVVRVEVGLKDSRIQRAIVLRDGAIVYAGQDIPTPYEFVTELGKHMRIGVLDTVLQFAAKRSSIQSVMRAMVEIGVLQWAEIAAANHQQSISVLKKVLPLPGQIILDGGPVTFDLQCETKNASSIVETLRRMSKLPNRQKQAAPPTAAQPHQSKPVILSVDDSPVAQALVKRALSKDYEILFSERAADALSILSHRSNISMLLLDLTLPGMSGLEFCRLLRGMKPYKELPIVMLTGRDGMVDRMRG
ncbi:MAG: response regulator, partial [Cyanobacteria bacterium J06641_5]